MIILNLKKLQNKRNDNNNNNNNNNIYIYILFFLGGAGIYNNIASKEDRQKSKLNKLC